MSIPAKRHCRSINFSNRGRHGKLISFCLRVRAKKGSLFRLPSRAENETRTRDPNLGKVVLYQLSYFRIIFGIHPSNARAKIDKIYYPAKFSMNFSTSHNSFLPNQLISESRLNHVNCRFAYLRLFLFINSTALSFDISPSK